ncbi:MAG: TetR/AcrR family transcriptional regulator [Oscillospiraceae bacterium]|nr:MAG: TetR/AcrR family transcriptional regulator [Oscillospiraceae bacterium]
MENQRVRLSKMLLKNALIKLLKEKPLEKITIYELCAEAQLNRVTFYKYYGSQYDLLTDIENDCFRKLEEILSDNGSDGEDCLCRMLEALLGDEEHFKVLINSLPDKDFQPSCSICQLSGSSLIWRFQKPLQRKNGTDFVFLLSGRICGNTGMAESREPPVAEKNGGVSQRDHPKADTVISRA